MATYNTTIWQKAKQRVFRLSMLATALGALGLTACTTTTYNQPIKGTVPPKTKSNPNSTPKANNSSSSEFLEADSFDSLEDLLYATDVRAVENDRLAILKHGNVWKRLPLGYRMGLDNVRHSRIDAQRNWFISRQPYLDRLSARASRYLFYTVREAERRGLPTELALLPVIESSYDPTATSSAAAAGLWQFIPSTGRSYGLAQNGMYDGRRDVVASTQAAYDFLSALYNQFGSWELALAAYNAGPGTIAKAIKRNEEAGLPTDYWSLRLPKETMDYVPRFIAVVQIVKNHAHYGVDLPAIANRPHFREIILSEPTDLNYVSQVTGLSRSELYALNPGYRGDMIDFNSSMRLLIPADLNPNIDAKLKGKVNNAWLTTTVSNPTPQPVVQSVGKNANAGQYITLPTNGSTPPQINSSVTSKPTTTARPEPAITAKEREQINQLMIDDTSVTTTITQVTQPANQVVNQVSSQINNQVNPQVVNQVTNQINNTVNNQVNNTVSQATTQVNQVATQVNTATTPSTGPVTVLDIKPNTAEATEIVPKTIPKQFNVEHKDVDLDSVETNLTVAEKTGQGIQKVFVPQPVATEKLTNNTNVAQTQNKPVIKVQPKEPVVTKPKNGKRTTYIVRKGDTLVSIANTYGLNWRDIAEWNQINPNGPLLADSPLYLYNAKSVASDKKPTAPAKKPDVYIVQSGDTLTGIADRFGMSIKQLADYNDLSVNSGVIAGQKLNLVETKSTKKTTPSSNNKKVATETYKVKRGENLTMLANRYEMTNQEFAELTNGIDSNSILREGQKINVPKGFKVTHANNPKTVEKATVTDTHVVKSGETLTSIAQKYHLQLDYLAGINGLSHNAKVNKGQKLKLTGELPKQASTKALAKETPVTTKSSSSSNSGGYVVKSGETLTSIAKREGVSLADLAAANKLTTKTAVRAGQTLVIPTKSSKKAEDKKADTKKVESKKVEPKKAKTVSYKVKSGDSLIGIAKRHGITPEELAHLNGLKPNANVQLGSTIKVPSK